MFQKLGHMRIVFIYKVLVKGMKIKFIKKLGKVKGKTFG